MRTLVALIFLGAVACGGTSPSRGAATTPAVAQAEDDCPVAVPGTSVTAVDTAAGGALVFVTTGDVAAVRARVGAWAQAHNQHHEAMGALPTGDEPAAMQHDHAAMQHDHAAMPHGAASAGDHTTMITIHSRAAAEDLDGGVRLVFTTFPDQIGALRDQLRAHAQHLASGTCAMGAPHGP